ncbi:MAG TPA: hypothetical protein VF163_07060 [Micromonosporaceae bacterium]
MSMNLALTIATPFLGLGVPALLVAAAVRIWSAAPDPLPRPEDWTWRQEMLRLVAADKLSDELRCARRELTHRRTGELLSRHFGAWSAPGLPAPPRRRALSAG